MATAIQPVAPLSKQPGHMKAIESIGRLIDIWGDWRDTDMLIMFAANGSAYWEIGDGDGIYLVTDIVDGHKAECHIKLTTPRFMGRKNDILHLAAINWVMDSLKLRRLGSHVPADNHKAIKFNERLGFKPEGTLRQYALRGNLYSDVWVGSICRE